jgi:hypothetical protein
MKILELYNMITYRPHLDNVSSAEPPLAEMVLRYYKSFPDFFTEEEANELTVEYIEKWYKQFMDKNN